MAKKIENKILSRFKENFMIIFGIFLAGFGLKGFLIPNGFLDGGVTGISLLISFLTPISLSVLIFILNLPFILLAKRHVGKSFALKTFLATIGLSIVLELVNFPVITSDKLLVSIFGGFFLGAGIGLSVRGGSVLDGTEILSVYLNKKTGFSMGEIVFGINILIFAVAGVLLSIEVALYSMVTYLVASKTIDFISQGLEEYKGMTIVSDKSEEIKSALISEMGLGVTVYAGKKGNGNKDKNIDILFTVVTRLDVFRVKRRILSLDSEALLIEQNVHDLYGGFINRRKPQILK